MGITQMKQVTIGYWRSLSQPELPMPEPDTPGKRQAEVIKALERALVGSRMVAYRGWSTCRLCGKENGSKEYEIIRGGIKYRIPQGYSHYLKQHNVGYDPRIFNVLDI